MELGKLFTCLLLFPLGALGSAEGPDIQAIRLATGAVECALPGPPAKGGTIIVESLKGGYAVALFKGMDKDAELGDGLLFWVSDLDIVHAADQATAECAPMAHPLPEGISPEEVRAAVLP